MPEKIVVSSTKKKLNGLFNDHKRFERKLIFCRVCPRYTFTCHRYNFSPLEIKFDPVKRFFPDYMWLHIRAVGQWTNRLFGYFEREQERLHNGDIPPLLPSGGLNGHHTNGIHTIPEQSAVSAGKC